MEVYVRYITERNLFCFCRICDRSRIKAIDSVGDPPLPIPNREVKPDSADGTAKICGRVGHRHFLRREFQVIETLFFLGMTGMPYICGESRAHLQKLGG